VRSEMGAEQYDSLGGGKGAITPSARGGLECEEAAVGKRAEA